MVLLNEVISTKIMIELVIYEVIYEILSFVERTKILQATELRYLLCATKGNFCQAARIISFCA